MTIVRRGNRLNIVFDPFKERRKVWVRVNTQRKIEAEQIEMAILTACRSGDYRALSPIAREATIRMFQSRCWQLPPSLSARESGHQDQLTLWKAHELFFKSPEIRHARGRWRYEFALAHVVAKFGKDYPLKDLRAPELKLYRVERVNAGAAPATVNRELSTLSKLFNVMLDLELVDENPVGRIKALSEKSGERQVYLSRTDVERIASKCPSWFQPIVWTAFYTGMRRGEILGLTRKRVNLAKRIIYLGPENTKEEHWKRVPIHFELLPVLEQVLRTPVLGSDKVFFLQDEKGIRPLGMETFKNPWERACKALQEEEQRQKPETPKWEKPWPRFHDLRGVWKTNARRSGMHPEIEMAIMGHSQRRRSVHERYGRISDRELLEAIDTMRFDHGETEILVSSRHKRAKRLAKG